MPAAARKTAVTADVVSDAPRLPSPAESSDPTVHHLLAQRQTLQLAIANAQADLATIADAEERLGIIHQQLVDMGY